MKILLVSPFLPYATVPHAGGKYIHMALEHLARRHDVDLVSRVFPEDEPYVAEAARLVRKFIPVSGGASASPQGGSVLGKMRSYRRLARGAERAVREGRYDLVLVEYTETGVFLDVGGWPPAVLDCHDVVTKPLYRKWKAAAGAARLARGLAFQLLYRVERRTAGKFRLVFARSHEDLIWANRWLALPDVRLLLFPAGAGMTVYARREIPGRILFLGAMGRQANVDAVLYFYRRVFPRVRQRFPEAQFWVVGANPPDALRALARVDSGLVVTGFVEDMGDCFASASVFVAPILVGGGIIVKILDAMCAGVPVVTTPYGNEGIRARDGEDLFVAGSPADFGDKVVALLEDPALRLRIGESGRGFAERNFDNAEILDGLEKTLEEIAGRSVPR